MVQAAITARQSAKAKVMDTTKELEASEKMLKVHTSDSACNILPAQETLQHRSHSASQ